MNLRMMHYYFLLQEECALVKIDIFRRVQGDVVLECVHLEDDLVREEMMFRVMFHTAFIRSNVLMLTRDEVDVLWDAKDQFPRDFKAEVGRCFTCLCVVSLKFLEFESILISVIRYSFRMLMLFHLFSPQKRRVKMKMTMKLPHQKSFSR